MKICDNSCLKRVLSPLARSHNVSLAADGTLKGIVSKAAVIASLI